MKTALTDARDEASIPVEAVPKKSFESWLSAQAESARRWITAHRFDAGLGSSLCVPGADGSIARVLVGRSTSPWDWGKLPGALPAGAYHLAPELPRAESDAAALGWALGSYRFESLRKADDEPRPSLAWPEAAERERVEAAIEATFLARDLINRPASDLGPAQLAEAARELAERHGAEIRIVEGDALLEEGYPAIHAVGRAATPERAPRLIDLRWGEASAPKVTLVGKGVCFDTGGLDLKPAAGMKLMKKDMGGAAHVLGIASMVMVLGVSVRLRVLIPAVENSVSGDAYRPLDVVPTRKGLNIEIGNTDAEGRVILSDALDDASSESPALLIDFATLTGAARIALGTELPALFSNDDALAEAILEHGRSESDPLWRMPLWQPYRRLIESKVADIGNAADAPFGGAITAALFLESFVGSGIPWAHVDVMAWNTAARPGRPEGGEAMGMRAVFALIEDRYPKRSSSGE